jgi:hypothetical protein
MNSYRDMLLTTNQVTTFTFWWKTDDVNIMSVLYVTTEEPTSIPTYDYTFPYMTTFKPTTDVLADYDRAMRGI